MRPQRCVNILHAADLSNPCRCVQHSSSDLDSEVTNQSASIREECIEDIRSSHSRILRCIAAPCSAVLGSHHALEAMEL